METLEDVIRAHPDVDTIPKAALFLSLIVPDDYTRSHVLPTRLSSPEAIAAIFYKEQGLFNLVKEKHSQQDFTDFWPAFQRTCWKYRLDSEFTCSLRGFVVFPGIFVVV
jgi:hypothetical protein